MNPKDKKNPYGLENATDVPAAHEDYSLEEILAEIPISMDVKAALLLHEGRCGALYDLVLSYERADWPAIGSLAGELEIPVNLLTNTYFQCLEEVNGIWAQLMMEKNQETAGAE